MSNAPFPEDCPERVVIYTTEWCPYCIRARRLLAYRKIEHRVIDVDGDYVARDWLRKRTGRNTVPQVFIDGRSIGGADELSRLDHAGTLEALLERDPPSRSL